MLWFVLVVVVDAEEGEWTVVERPVLVRGGVAKGLLGLLLSSNVAVVGGVPMLLLLLL